MVKKITKYLKFVICCALIMSLIAPSYAALSASDGSAFVTKAEFDSALADFNARLTTFEAGINSKIDSQVSSYLDRNGIWNGQKQVIEENCYSNILDYGQIWSTTETGEAFGRMMPTIFPVPAGIQPTDYSTTFTRVNYRWNFAKYTGTANLSNWQCIRPRSCTKEIKIFTANKSGLVYMPIRVRLDGGGSNSWLGGPKGGNYTTTNREKLQEGTGWEIMNYAAGYGYSVQWGLLLTDASDGVYIYDGNVTFTADVQKRAGGAAAGSREVLQTYAGPQMLTRNFSPNIMPISTWATSYPSGWFAKDCELRDQVFLGFLSKGDELYINNKCTVSSWNTYQYLTQANQVQAERLDFATCDFNSFITTIREAVIY